MKKKIYVYFHQMLVKLWAEHQLRVIKFRVRHKFMRYVRQRYAGTDVKVRRVFTVEITVLEFLCAFYRLGMSNLGVSLMIKGKNKIW